MDRSAIMRAVKSRDTSPERAVRKLLSTSGYCFRLHDKKLVGLPDIVFPGRKKAIFVHGCFWHGHNCKRGARIPKSNREYWTAKITRNRSRDTKNRKALKQSGWEVLTVWECETRKSSMLQKKLSRFLGQPKRTS